MTDRVEIEYCCRNGSYRYASMAMLCKYLFIQLYTFLMMYIQLLAVCKEMVDFLHTCTYIHTCTLVTLVRRERPNDEIFVPPEVSQSDMTMSLRTYVRMYVRTGKMGKAAPKKVSALPF